MCIAARAHQSTRTDARTHARTRPDILSLPSSAHHSSFPLLFAHLTVRLSGSMDCVGNRVCQEAGIVSPCPPSPSPLPFPPHPLPLPPLARSSSSPCEGRLRGRGARLRGPDWAYRGRYLGGPSKGHAERGPRRRRGLCPAPRYAARRGWNPVVGIFSWSHAGSPPPISTRRDGEA